MRALARLLALLSAGASGLFFFRVKSPVGALLLLPKMLAEALSPSLVVIGALGGGLGLLMRDPLALVAGGIGALVAARYVRRVTAPHEGFKRAFGPNWRAKIPPQQAARMLARRWSWRLPDSPEPRLECDVAFWTIPGSGRRLLCDVWRPPQQVPPSGLAVVYLHSSGWHWLDKDVGTRLFFRHLAAQGHVVMDVAYRLCPETDLCGMVGDAKRAIAWMKANAGRYGVQPERIVVAGASAGGQIALLAAYAPDHPELTPDDVNAADTSVRAVIAFYAPASMRAYCEHTAPALMVSRRKADDLVQSLRARAGRGRRRGPMITHEEMMVNVLGGQPDEVPDRYELASPVAHVTAGSPPTLLLHGEHDSFVPAAATCALYCRLVGAGVPAVHVEFPQTEHAFDLASTVMGLGDLSQHSPPAQAALYDVERFLALMAALEVLSDEG